MAKRTGKHILGKHLNAYKDMTEVVPGVFVDPGHAVYIVDEIGEVVTWNADEWAEDPEAVTAAINASILAAAKGPYSVRRNVVDGGVIQDLIDETMAQVRPYGKQTIIIPIEGYSIVLQIGPPNDEGGRSGEIETNLADRLDSPEGDTGDHHVNGMIDALESLILAQAIAGIDVTTDNYVEALRVALDAIENRS